MRGIKPRSTMLRAAIVVAWGVGFSPDSARTQSFHLPNGETRQEFLVRSHNALGILAWRESQYTEAMRWLTMAEEEQTRAGGNWVPDLTANRKRLEGIIASPQTR